MKINAVKAMIIISLIIICLYVLGLFIPIIINTKESKIYEKKSIEYVSLEIKNNYF